MVSVFGMTSKCYNLLLSLIDSFGNSFVDLVVCARDKNIEDDHYDEIRSLCGLHNIRFCDRTESYQIHTKYSFAISWRWLINLDPAKKLIVFHDSILPKYRGFAPLVNCLIHKEETIGVTALFADKEYDRGDIIYQSVSQIKYPAKISEAITIIDKNYKEACIEVSKMIRDNIDLPSVAQNDADATYSLWRDEDDYAIDWTKDAEFILRFIQATGHPYKGASTLYGDQKIRIINAEEVKDVKIINRDAGKVLFLDNDLPVVVCGTGLLKITEAYFENKSSVLPLKKFRTRFK
jgi:methionyl-tRNA formyltransferase